MPQCVQDSTPHTKIFHSQTTRVPTVNTENLKRDFRVELHDIGKNIWLKQYWIVPQSIEVLTVKLFMETFNSLYFISQIVISLRVVRQLLNWSMGASLKPLKRVCCIRIKKIDPQCPIQDDQPYYNTT